MRKSWTAGTRTARTLSRLTLSRHDCDLVRVVVSSPCESCNSEWLIKSKSEMLSVTSQYDATDVQGDQRMMSFSCFTRHVRGRELVLVHSRGTSRHFKFQAAMRGMVGRLSRARGGVLYTPVIDTIDSQNNGDKRRCTHTRLVFGANWGNQSKH